MKIKGNSGKDNSVCKNSSIIKRFSFLLMSYFILNSLMFYGQSNSRIINLKHFSLTIDSLIQLAQLADSMNDFQQSIDYYTEILQRDSIKPIALINRGRALISIGQIEKGFEDYDKAVKYYPDENTYYARGMAYIRVKDYTNAFPDFASAAHINPDFGQAYYGYSLIKINDKQYRFALYWCNKADSLSYIPGLSKYIHDEIENGQKGK